MSKFQQANKRIEAAVVGGCKKIERGVVSGCQKIEDRFVDAFLAAEGETTEEAKVRLKKDTQRIKDENRNRDGRTNK